MPDAATGYAAPMCPHGANRRETNQMRARGRFSTRFPHSRTVACNQSVAPSKAPKPGLPYRVERYIGTRKEQVVERHPWSLGAALPMGLNGPRLFAPLELPTGACLILSFVHEALMHLEATACQYGQGGRPS